MGIASRSRVFRRLGLRAGSILVLLAFLGGLYWAFIRPAQLRWGATPVELSARYPADDFVSHPAFDATRAISVHATPQEIWPWLAQMGYGRAGFYGYDLIENPGSGAGLRSANTIFSNLQDPQPGDVLPLSKVASLRFGVIDPPRTLVWLGRESPPRGVFVWTLVPQDATHTRLISRIRWRYTDDATGRALGLFTEFADHVAVKEILRGVRDRAEGHRTASLWVQGFEIAAWLSAFFQLCVGAILILLVRRWRFMWFFALGAGLVLCFTLYGPAPHWLNALLPWVYLLLFVYSRRMRFSRSALQEHIGQS